MGTLDRFEGAYGAAYDAVLQRPWLRRAVFRAIGDAAPIVELEDAVEQLVAYAPSGMLLDVPCGGGTMLPLLHRAGFHGTVVAVDLAGAMIRRTRGVAEREGGPFEVEVLRADATRLPLEDDSFDLAASINGLHVMPDARAVVDELARVLRPGGVALVVSITATSGIRNRALRALGRAGSVMPRPLEPRDELLSMFDDAGFDVERDLGGTTFAGLLLRRRG